MDEEPKDRFRFLNSINNKTELDDDFIDYSPYFTNLMLSYHYDCIYPVFKLDRYNQVPSKSQYLYLLNTVRRKRRFTKLHRVEKDSNLNLIQAYYGFGPKKAKEALSILNSEQIDIIRKKRDKGGTKRIDD